MPPPFEENLAAEATWLYGVKPLRLRGKRGGEWTPCASCNRTEAPENYDDPAVGSVPISEDFLRFHHLLLGAGEIEPQFSRLACDLNFDGIQTIAFHAGAELFVGFVEAVFLEAIAHG
jgi:hypothetical protein